MKINWKLYLDTSVFGGCYDEAEGWDEDSKRVLNCCQVGRAKLIRKSYEDCIHVAAATISRAHAIVSWNFKHIVRLDKIRAFNTVNLTLGYGMITILSPVDVYLENLDED